jgi:N-acetylneuraminic acid mutarotase
MTVISDAATGIAATSSGSKDIGSQLTAGFRASANLVTARAMTPAVVLDDGRVLVTNGLGRNAQNAAVYLTTSEIYDPVTNTWTPVQAISGNAGFQLAQVPGSNPPNIYAIFRYDHTATKLASGKVLIAGGTGSERFDPANPQNRLIEDLTSCFLYDPANDTFDPAGTGMLNVARSAHYATLLPNGQVLIAGGYNEAINNGQGGSLPVGELFDEATGTFTMLSAGGNDMVFPRQEGTADLVGNKVLFAGGMLVYLPQGGTQVALALAPNSEAYDVATRDFAADAQFTARRWHDSAKLPSGELVMVGGDNGQVSIATVEKYDPMTNMFAPMGNLTNARARAKAVVVDGNVLVVGGIAINRATGGQLVTEVANGELYNVQFNVSESYQLLSPRNNPSVVSLQNGRKAMVIGGYMGSTTFYGFTAAPVAACETFQIP